MALTKSNDANISNFLIEEFSGKNIRIRDTDGYVNASDICKVKPGKLPANYFENKTSKKFIKQLSITIGIPIVSLINKINGGKTPGTWIHPRLAVDFARWVSAELAVKMNGWLSRFISGDLTMVQDVVQIHDKINDTDTSAQIASQNGETIALFDSKLKGDYYSKLNYELLKDKIKELEDKNNGLIKEKEDLNTLVRHQSKKMDEQSKQINELLGYSKEAKVQNTELIQKIDTQSAKIVKLLEYSKDTKVKNTELNQKIDTQSAKIDTQSAKIDTQSAKIDTQSEKIDTQSEKIDTQSAKIDKIVKNYVKMDGLNNKYFKQIAVIITRRPKNRCIKIVRGQKKYVSLVIKNTQEKYTSARCIKRLTIPDPVTFLHCVYQYCPNLTIDQSKLSKNGNTQWYGVEQITQTQILSAINQVKEIWNSDTNYPDIIEEE